MSNHDGILSSYRKLRNMHTVTILFIGSESIHKNKLAEAIIERTTIHPDKSHISVNCRTAVKLPLPADPENKRPNIDYVVLLTDNLKESYMNMRRSIKNLDVDYFLGKMSLVLVSSPSDFESDVTMDAELNLRELADVCRTSPLFLDMENSEDVKAVAELLLHKVEIAAGLKEGISPLLLMGSRQPYSRFEEL